MSCGIVPLIYQCGPMLSMSQVGISTVLHWVVQLERHTIMLRPGGEQGRMKQVSPTWRWQMSCFEPTPGPLSRSPGLSLLRSRPTAARCHSSTTI